jgi:hypothetical protein
MTTRTQISGAGSFIAPPPEALPNTPASLRNVIKLEHRTLYSEKEGYDHVFFTDRILIDICGLDILEVDFQRAAIDCDLMKEIILKHSSELKEILIALQRGGSDNINKIEPVLQRIGFTEEEFLKKGGGWIILLLPLLAGGCATLSSNKTNKQNTTPSAPRPAPSNDAGPDGGGTPQ